jgi:cyclomaltodextrinase / maltogenic alpha-amylase / neopullulanase
MIVQFNTPEWVKDAVFYQIFPDRFATSERVEKPNNLEPWESPPTTHGFKGGDLLGIAEHLDYLKDLGITAIYLNPIFQSASNHRYHTHDYYQVDPILGGERAFRKLLRDAHRKDIRVVLDGVFNHASRGFFQFNHILECGASSPYIDWFEVESYPVIAYINPESKANYRCWLDLPALPEFNTNNPQVRKYLFDIARYWLKQGIDGWRLDVPNCIDDDSFWQEFRQIVKSVNPEAYIVGEIASEAQRWLQGDQFDAVMNYQFTQACLGFFIGDKLDRDLEAGMMGLPKTKLLDAKSFARRVEELLAIYPREIAYAQLNLLDSHDMPRFLSIAGGDLSALRLATLFQMTYPGAPSIYYGDEVGMKGGTDPDCRRSMLWGDRSGSGSSARFAPHPSWDMELRNYVKKCIAMRHAHPALRRGVFISLYAEGEVYAYLRRLEGDICVIVLNTGSTSYALDIPVKDYLPEGIHLENRIGGGVARVIDSKITRLALPPRSGLVLSN